MKHLFTLLMILFTIQVFGQRENSSDYQPFEVKVHPGTELLHVVNYLAGVYQPTARGAAFPLYFPYF
jgi:hypothetical protein